MKLNVEEQEHLVDVCVYDIFAGITLSRCIVIRRGLLRLARSTLRGKFQGLNTWDERAKTPTLFIISAEPFTNLCTLGEGGQKSDSCYLLIMTSVQRISLTLALLLSGVLVYVLFRSNVLFVRTLIGPYKGPFEDFAAVHSGNPAVYFLAYCLSDALWYAALLVLQRPCNGLGIGNRLLFYVSAALPFMLELLQWAKVIPGTYDVFDIITYLFTLLIFCKL